MSNITSPQQAQPQKTSKRHGLFKKKQQIPVIPPEDAPVVYDDQGESSGSTTPHIPIPYSDDSEPSSLSHSYNETIHRNPSPTKPPKTSRFHRKKKESMPNLALSGGDDDMDKTASYPKPTNGITSTRKKSRKSVKNKNPLPLTPIPNKSQRKPGTISQILSFQDSTDDSTVSFYEPSIFAASSSSSSSSARSVNGPRSSSLNNSPAAGPVVIPGIKTPPCMSLENEYADTGVFATENELAKSPISSFSEDEHRKPMSVPLEAAFDDYSSSDESYSDESTPVLSFSSSSGIAVPRLSEGRLPLPGAGGSESTLQISARGYNSGDYVGLVHLLVVDAMNIPRKDHIKRSSSPFIVIRYGDSVQNTSIIRNSLAPVWMETYNFLVKETSKSYVFRFDMYNWEHTKNRFIGAGEISCNEIWDDDEEHNYIIPLFSKKGKDAGIINVKIKMRSKAEINQMFWLNVLKQLDNTGSGTLDKFDIAEIAELLDGSILSDEIDRLIAEEAANPSQAPAGLPSSSSSLLMSSSSSSSSSHPAQGRITHQSFINWVTRSKENTLKIVFEEDLIWKLSVFIEDENDASVVLKDTEKFIGAPAISDTNIQTIFSGKLKKLRILVKERLTGQIIEEKISPMIKLSMRVMYSNVKGRKTISNKTIRRLLGNLTNSQGKSYDHPKSAKQIPKFIKYHKLDMSEYEGSVEDFKNFNQFFYRKLKPGKRVIDHPADPKIAISPADCRMSLFSTIDSATEIWIKGKNFSLENLLQDSALASEFSGGSIVIARLAPQDYHVTINCYFHFLIFHVLFRSQLYHCLYFVLYFILIAIVYYFFVVLIYIIVGMLYCISFFIMYFLKLYCYLNYFQYLSSIVILSIYIFLNSKYNKQIKHHHTQRWL